MCNKNRRGWSFALLFIAFLCAGCNREEKTVEQKQEEPVKIPVVFRVDPATNVSNNLEFVEEFNALYEGEYVVEVEWLTESTAGYRERLKQWNVLDEMPAVITDAGFDYDFYRLLVEEQRLVDLRPYMEQAPEWKDTFRSEILEECQEEDGAIYLSPLGSSIQSYAGILYNKELLAQAGYEEFPQTWEDFFDCLEKLKAQGIMPLSLHGSGSYWVPMLFATSYIYGTEEGTEFLKEDFPKSYQNESMYELLEVLTTLFAYTFEDAVEIEFDTAAERFQKGEAAIFANGYWMVEEMPEEVKEQMGFAPFPGNILMNSPRMSAWAVTAGYDAEVTQGAVKLLEYRSQREGKNTQRLYAKENLNSLQEEYVEAVEQSERVMPNYQMKWEQEIQTDLFNEYLPIYLKGEMSKEAFLEEMDKRLEAIRLEK